VVHSREATSETLEILDREKPEKVVFHCFTGNWEEAKSILDRGYYLSFSGVITFGPKVAYLEEVVKKAPLDRIFVETDAPFLTPVPHRGKRNEPAWVRYVGEKVAEIKKKDPGEIADATGANVKAFFSI
jgi:TatD DNase family protein